MAKAVADDTLFATDILEYLVRKKVPFSEAHSTVGQAVRFAAESGKGLRELSLREWKRFSPGIGADIYDLFDPETSVRGKKTIGSTHPLKVRQQMDYWTRLLA